MVLGWRSQSPIFLEAPSHPFFSSYYLESRAPLTPPPPSPPAHLSPAGLSPVPQPPSYLSHLPPSETCRLFFSLPVSSGPRQAADPALQALMPCGVRLQPSTAE